MAHLVSVIIPNYNHAVYLQQRIDSVLQQTYNAFEVIIMDDCSTDNSREIIEQYRGHAKISQILLNNINSGSTFLQWNKGVAAAKGSLVWIAESDDVATPDFLTQLVTAFNEREDTVISYCQSQRMSSEGEITGTWLNWTDELKGGEVFNHNFSMGGEKYIEQFLIYRNTIPNASAVVFKKSAYLAVGGADASIKYCSDWLTWLKMLSTGSISFHAEAKNKFRYHNSSVIGTVFRTKLFQKKYDIIMRRAFEQFLKKQAIDAMYRRLNTQLRTEEIAFEAAYMRQHRKYTAAANYYFMKWLQL